MIELVSQLIVSSIVNTYEEQENMQFTPVPEDRQLWTNKSRTEWRFGQVWSSQYMLRITQTNHEAGWGYYLEV